MLGSGRGVFVVVAGIACEVNDTIVPYNSTAVALIYASLRLDDSTTGKPQPTNATIAIQLQNFLVNISWLFNGHKRNKKKIKYFYIFYVESTVALSNKRRRFKRQGEIRSCA